MTDVGESSHRVHNGAVAIAIRRVVAAFILGIVVVCFRLHVPLLFAALLTDLHQISVQYSSHVEGEVNVPDRRSCAASY